MPENIRNVLFNIYYNFFMNEYFLIQNILFLMKKCLSKLIRITYPPETFFFKSSTFI